MSKTLTIGEFKITKRTDGSFWIESESGEVIQVDAEDLERAVEEFFRENF